MVSPFGCIVFQNIALFTSNDQFGSGVREVRAIEGADEALEETAKHQALLASVADVAVQELVPGEGFEPPTFGLQNRCTTPVLTRRPKEYRPMGVSLQWLVQ